MTRKNTEQETIIQGHVAKLTQIKKVEGNVNVNVSVVVERDNGVHQNSTKNSEKEKTDNVTPSLPLNVARERAYKLLEIVSCLEPIFQKLGLKQEIRNLQKKQSRLRSLLERTPKAHIALLGVTGAGKTTLLNAITGMKIGVAGGGGAQSATAIALEYSATSQYEVVIRYLSFEDIRDLLRETKLRAERRDLSKLPDQQGVSQEMKNLLLALSLPLETLLEKEDITLDDISEQTRSLLQKRQVTHIFTIKEEISLLEFIRQHTNRSGVYWPITDLIEIKGPFPGIPTGVVIWDLPGLGDLSQLRISRTQKYIERADQVIIVVNERGILKNIKEFLSDLRFISRILTYDDIPQITIVGTRLDERVLNLTDRERKEFNIEPHTSKGEILQKIFRDWEKMVKEQWRDILLKWGLSTQGERLSGRVEIKVKNIVLGTEVVPTTPLTYLRLKGIESDWLGIAKQLCQNENCTGIPRVRQSIKRMIEQQERLLSAQIKEESLSLSQWAQSNTRDILVQVQSDIKSSVMVAKFWENIKKCSHISQRWRIRVPKNSNLGKQIKEEIKRGWSDLDADALYKMLEPYNRIHYQTLRAALRRRGIFQSKGKSKAFVNIPGAAGAYVVEPIVLAIKDFLSKVTDVLQQQVEERTEFYISTISECAHQSAADATADLLVLVQTVKNVLEQHRDAIENLSNEISFTEEGLIEHVFDALGHGMMHVMTVALEEKGKGARDRAITDIATLIPRLLPAVAQDASAKLSQDVNAMIKQKILRIQELVFSTERATTSLLIEKGKLSIQKLDARLKLKPLERGLADVLEKATSLF